MGIKLSINGGTATEGFLIAPSGDKEFPACIGLKTDDGSEADATLEVTAAGGVSVELSQTQVTVPAKGTSVDIVAKSASNAAGDIRLEVKVNGNVEASLTLTSIADPRIRFGGRFQARFATDGDFFNEPRGTDAGWTWALEGEPDFVPATNNVPTSPGMAVGRVVRFQNAVAPRPHVAPIGVVVTAIEGEVGGNTVSFAAGDPVIGVPVSLGPNSYFASNEPQNPADPPPFESYGAGFEVMDNFELAIGDSFSGKPAALNDRPKANGFFPFTAAEMQQLGIIPLSQFNSQRKAALLADYQQLSPADQTGTAEGRNLATRISHLGGSAPHGIPPSQGTLPFGWSGRETYNGVINDAIQINQNESPVMAYFADFHSFIYSGTHFNFHSDELCGRFDGTLTAQTRALMRLPE